MDTKRKQGKTNQAYTKKILSLILHNDSRASLFQSVYTLSTRKNIEICIHQRDEHFGLCSVYRIKLTNTKAGHHCKDTRHATSEHALRFEFLPKNGSVLDRCCTDLRLDPGKITGSNCGAGNPSGTVHLSWSLWGYSLFRSNK